MHKKIDIDILDEFERLCELFAEAWSTEIALLDMSTSGVIYSTEKLTQLTGVSNEEIVKQGSSFFDQLIHPKDLELVHKVHAKTIKLFNKQYYKALNFPFIFSTYQFQLKTADNTYHNKSVFIKPAYFSETGIPLLGYAVAYNDVKMGFERFTLSNMEKKKKLYYASMTDKFVDWDTVKLKQIEIDILSLTSKGYSEAKIAKELGVKLDLLRYYKKSIYKKYHVSNIAEAVYIALFYELI
jgi:DNA-binding CsgD family transcriptional regulator